MSGQKFDKLNCNTENKLVKKDFCWYHVPSQ